MKECNIEKVTEALKQFMMAQVKINDLTDADIEKLTHMVEELDEQTAETIAKLLGRIIILEKKIAELKDDNNNIKRKFGNKADKKINKDINNIYHHLKENRKSYNNFHEDVNDRISDLFAVTEVLADRIYNVSEFAHSIDRVVRRLCVDLDKIEREEKENNASNK